MSYYTWITTDIAIGELSSSYHEFDTIVNLAYINPSVNCLEHGQLLIEYRQHKTIYKVAVYDTDNDCDLFSEMLTKLLSTLDTPGKILFHCQAGKSRSVSMALAYLCKTTGMSVEKGLELIKDRRPVINPRSSFVEIVKKYINVI